MTTDAAISVVLPCYNAAEFIEGAVQRLLEQDGGPLEILSHIHISEPTRPEPISYAVFCL
jgi:hypothetical protein